MKKLITLLSLVSLITYATCFGMEKGSLGQLKTSHEEALQARTAGTSKTGSTTSTSTGSTPVITFTEIPSETATASESAPTTVVITAPALKQLENLNTEIKRLEQRIEFLQKESPIKNFNINQDFAAGFAWLKSNRAEFISEKARTLAYETLKQLESYKVHERELKKLEATIEEKEKELEEETRVIETLQKTADELEALADDMAAKNPDDPSLDDKLTKAENAIQQLNTHKDKSEAMLKNHDALVQEYEQGINKLEEKEASLKKTFNEAIQTEQKASDDFEASKREKWQTSLQDLIQAKKNLEATKDRLLKKPSPKSSRTPSPSTVEISIKRIETPRIFATEIAKLNYAIQKGNFEQVQDLITNNQSLINTVDENSNNRTPLHIAAMHGQIKIMLELLSRGAKIDAKDAYQETPLHLAAMQGQTSAIYVLIEALRSQIKQTLQASQEEQLGDEELTMKVDQVVQEIVNAKDKYHDTPLYYAIKFNHPTAAIMLIYNCNANVNLTNINPANNKNRYLTPLDLVLRKIEELKKTSASENTIKTWIYLRDIIRQHNGMTHEELRQQTLALPFATSPSTSPSPTSMLSSPSTSASSLSMLASISPTESSEQTETIAAPITMRMLPVTIISSPAQEGSMFYPSISSQEPRLEWPSMPVTMEARTQNLNVQQPIAQQQTAMAQRLEAALATLTMRDAAESKEAKPTQRRS